MLWPRRARPADVSDAGTRPEAREARSALPNRAGSPSAHAVVRGPHHTDAGQARRQLGRGVGQHRRQVLLGLSDTRVEQVQHRHVGGQNRRSAGRSAIGRRNASAAAACSTWALAVCRRTPRQAANACRRPASCPEPFFWRGRGSVHSSTSHRGVEHSYPGGGGYLQSGQLHPGDGGGTGQLRRPRGGGSPRRRLLATAVVGDGPCHERRPCG